MEVSGAMTSSLRPLPYTPQEVAVKLVNGAIHYVEDLASKILDARASFVAAWREAEQKGMCRSAVEREAASALREISILSRRSSRGRLSALAREIDNLYAACFICISYLTGARLSEILRLRLDCARPGGGQKPGRIVGAIYKKQPNFAGTSHEWIAPPAALKAIAVLEKLSAPHRARMESNLLWLRQDRHCGAREWLGNGDSEVRLPLKGRVNLLLQRFARCIGATDHAGKEWRITTHQGRKTFARFIALRDRTALLALAQQLGHRERGVTDRSYCGHDYRLNEEIDREVLAQSVGAWEEMLSAPHLAGKAGLEISAKRPRFRGSRAKEDIVSYAKLLVDAGLVLAVCDWGYCVYRKRSSACGGNSAGPNPARRTPSVCATCSNFAVAPKHAAYWSFQRMRSLELLREPLLPRQTRELAKERALEAERVLESLGKTPKSD
jgi:integrase